MRKNCTRAENAEQSWSNFEIVYETKIACSKLECLVDTEHNEREMAIFKSSLQINVCKMQVATIAEDQQYQL